MEQRTSMKELKCSSCGAIFVTESVIKDLECVCHNNEFELVAK